MTQKESGSRFVDFLRSAYLELLDRGVVTLQIDERDSGIIAKVEPTGLVGPRVELRATGTAAELFVDDLDPFEVDEKSIEDVREFDSLVRALVNGDVELVHKRTLTGWRPAGIHWAGGAWSLPGNPGVLALLSPNRRTNLPGYH